MLTRFIFRDRFSYFDVAYIMAIVYFWERVPWWALLIGFFAAIAIAYEGRMSFQRQMPRLSGHASDISIVLMRKAKKESVTISASDIMDARRFSVRRVDEYAGSGSTLTLVEEIVE